MSRACQRAAIVCLFFLFTQGVRAQTSALFTVQQNGSRDQCINIVFLSEGYTTSDMPNFAGHVTNAMNYLFTREPWQQYRSYCNVYRIEIASTQSGCDNGNTSGANSTRDTYFNAGFDTPAVPQLLTLGSGGSTKVFNLLNTHVPEYDLAVVIVNDTKYGGAGGSPAIASVNGSSAAIVEHEIAHSFAGLVDEYDIEYPGYTPTEAPNNTAQTTRELIRWNHWIDASTPIPTPETVSYTNIVGLFEGSMYRTTGWYRPHYNSLMKNLSQPCGAVNREQYVLQYYQRVSPVNGYTPATLNSTVTSSTDLSFQVTPKAPSSGVPLQVSWAVDGVVRSDQTTPSFTTTSNQIGNGQHTVTATVKDPTPFVRFDPNSLLQEVITWNLSLSNQVPYPIVEWRAAYGADDAVISSDGLQNLVKFALGLPANIPATAAQMPTASTTAESGNSYLTLTVPRDEIHEEVIYTVQVSSDLALWQSGPGHTVVVVDNDNLLVVRDAVPTTSHSRRFIRLSVRVTP